MDWNDNADQLAFRAQVRAVIAEHLPARYRALAEHAHEGERQWEFDRKADDPEARQAASEWAGALAARHWVAPHWPAEYGGGGMTVAEQFIFRQEMAEAAAPAVGGSGVSLLGPTLIVHGTEEQRKKYLPPILAGERVWAQGYSEPGAGSDLAGVQTRAVRDGDEYIVNGQKIWTSGAHAADAIFALTRTDPEAPKHRGISFLLIDDIHAPGINVRPLVNMNDKLYFNETFFEDVRVPATNLVGEENRGWYVGMTLLDFERSNIGGAVGARRTLRALIGHATSGAAPAMRQLGAESRRGALADRWIETEVMFQHSFRIVSMQQAGLIPNHEASTAKLFNSELVQRLALTGTRVFGLYSNLGDETTPAGDFARAYLAAVPATIRGGTSEVQRNIIATRGLGLPRG
ncbi:MAG: acyl-CoA dehydrogenase family protein [Chloroflexi bacterium]|nr:acyl-CoA dehydrogenase family protein [Chloroflexota bacterium]MDA1145823.1 acyl-CoA dehydrogenase family protein [Chloroflexota bacterium]